MEFLVTITSIFLGFSCSLLLMAFLLHKQNNYGTDTGDYRKYADKPMNYFKMEDNIKEIK